MGRNKIIETDEIISFIERCAIENPYTKITAADVARLINQNGYEGVEGRIINRNKKAKEYLDKVNSQRGLNELEENKYVVYSTLDVDEFISKNNNYESLKKALVQRDEYYRNVCNNANRIQKENKELKNKLKKQNKEDNLDLTKKNKILKKIIDKYINPSIANEILVKEGLLKEVNSVIDPDNVEILPATTKFDNDNLNKIARMFDD